MSNFKHSFFRTLLYAQLLSGFSGVAIAAQISLSVKDRPMRAVSYTHLTLPTIRLV